MVSAYKHNEMLALYCVLYSGYRVCHSMHYCPALRGVQLTILWP